MPMPKMNQCLRSVFARVLVYSITIMSLSAQHPGHWDLLLHLPGTANVPVNVPRGIGDQNGDGYDDVIVGNKINGEWHNLFYYGGSPMDTVPDFDFGVIPGSYVTFMEDIDGDSIGEYMLGNHFYYGGLPLHSEPDLIFPRYFLPDGEGLLLYNNVGDINGDGWEDLVSFKNEHILDTNAYTIYFGGPNLDTIADILLWEDPAYDSSRFGWPVDYQVDFNLDGFYDQKLTIYGYWGELVSHHIWLGPIEDAAPPDTVFPPTLNADSSYYYFGSYKGDYNGDGITDMIKGSLRPDTNFSASRMVVSGAGGFEQETVIGQLNLPTFIEGLIPCGDINGDSYTDLIGGYRHSFGVGALYLYLGGPEMGLAYLGGPDVYWYGGYEAGYPDFGVGTAYYWTGDVNGDGLDDIGSI